MNMSGVCGRELLRTRQESINKEKGFFGESGLRRTDLGPGVITEWETADRK